MDQKKIGGFLKELRKEKGITQEELAEKLALSVDEVERLLKMSEEAGKQ